MKKVLFVILFMLFGIQVWAAESFRFRYIEGQQFHIEGVIEEEVYRNDTFIMGVSIKNVGDLTVTAVSGDRALHEGRFQYFKSEGGRDFILEETYPTRFYRDVYGNYEIAPVYFMPVVRGVPSFPKSPLEIGDQWRSRAHEAHDFRAVFGIDEPVILPAAVSYQYIGNRIIDGERVAEISINYVINYTMRYGDITGYQQPLPYRVVGYFNQLYLWNLDRGVPHSYRENFDYIFIMSDGEVVEYTGSSRGVLTVTESLDESEKVALAIQKRLEKNLPDVSVSTVPEGISINVGEILFRFDSDELSERASGDLDNIVNVLEDYTDRKIRVIGHTDSTGPADYNLSLSLKRARRTALELKERLPSLRSRITYIGMGESSPIASNETEAGRKQNRRVEIIILNE
jgi:outer membrane protein OmpA-like peptidoglycan-associated protein